ncbi:hypothetical protein [Cupriavidus sp. PET2-C1]
MGNRYRYSAPAALAVASMLLGGCAPTTVGVTSRASDYTGKPTRMYVLGTTGMGWNSDFSAAFAAKFREVTRQCGVESAYDEISGLELDSTALTGRMRTFAADTVLTIANGGGVVNASGGRLSINYGTTLTDVRQNRAVWKGKYTFSRGGTLIPIEERAAVLAIDITNSLKKDGFLTGCAQIALGQNGRLDPAAVPHAAAGGGTGNGPAGRTNTISPARPAPPVSAPAGPATAATLRDLQDLLPPK